MKIVLSGYPAGGKTTLAKEIEAYYNFSRIDAGDIVLEESRKRGISIFEFDEILQENPAIDYELDRRIKQRVFNKKDVVLESCYSGHQIDDVTLHAWVEAPRETRIDRFADREGFSKSKSRSLIKKIEDSIRFRAKCFYGIDIEDKTQYDLIIETKSSKVSESFGEIQDQLSTGLGTSETAKS